MSNIVAFKPDQTGRPAPRLFEPMGQILFFTGVRYFRDEEPEPVVRKPRKRPQTTPGERLKA